MNVNEIIRYTDQLLDITSFDDYCPNGLQVQGREDVELVVTGVSASLALLEAARDRGADLVVVHHGYFWKGEDPRITGMKKQRLDILIKHDINLAAYHLPLDAHAELGNNVQLARELGIRPAGSFGRGPGPHIGMIGELDEPADGEGFAQHIEQCLGRTPLYVAGNDNPITTLAWCTGGAQSYIEAAAAQGVDAFITGEVSEQTVHVARELGIHFYAAGHHATERYGARALGQHLADRFSLEQEFIDIDNPA